MNEPFSFELQFEKVPQTGRGLQLVALPRLDDLQRDLIHGTSNRAPRLVGCLCELAVQKWMADRLRQVQGSAYSIEREVHVADEKKPGLRFRAKATDASAATEIKVAESCSVKQLEYVLETQLCGQYLRAQDGCEGILLLVHQQPRKKDWKLPDNA